MESCNNSSADSRLLEAAAEGQTDLVLQLLEEEGSKLHDHKNQDGKTALHMASSGGHVETVAALTLNGADVSAQDHTGHTALQRAASEGHTDVVQHLIERGSPVDHQDEVHGNTALHEAAWKGYSRTVELLCKNRSNYYLRNRGGFSALHLCCQNGHNESCRVILRAGCKPNIKNNYGDTPLHTASRYGHAGVARILLSAQANPNLQNKNGDSPIHIAAAMGRRKLVRILMETGLVDLAAKNQQQETPIDIAARKRYSEISEILKNPPKPVKPGLLAGTETRDEIDEREVDVPENARNHDTKTGGKHQNKKHSKKGARSIGRHRLHVKGQKDPGWSPYGCHYYPDLNEFPVPRMESLPKDPLSPGEQYYLDLAGNIRKGPVSDGYTCYCTPFIERFEQKLDRNKRDLVKHLESTHGKLAHRISHLERKTRDQISSLSNSMKESIAQERVECQDRVERRAIRDRVAIERQQVVRDLMLKGDLSSWLDQRLNEVQQCQEQKHREEAALMRTLLRGSRRRKRAIISEMQQTGSLRRALSEDELGPGDIEDNKKQDDAFMLVAQLDSDENLAVQSEYGGGGGFKLFEGINQFKPFNYQSLETHLEELRVSDHPHLDAELQDSPVYQNAGLRIHPKTTTVRVRRSSAGDQATLICDFGDFNTQELITQDCITQPPQDFSPGPASLSSFHRANGRTSQDVLNYSTNSESYQGTSSVASLQSSHRPYTRSSQNTEHSGMHRINSETQQAGSPGGIYQNYTHSLEPVQPKPMKPFSPTLFSNHHPSLGQNNQFYQNQAQRPLSKPSPPPRVPAKHITPPPYRPPPKQTSLTNLQRNYNPLYPNPHHQHQQPLQAFFMPPIEEDSTGANLMLNPLMVSVHSGARFDRHPMLGMTTTSGALSSSDGGSHDSHNDSGYCAVRLGGGGGSSAAGSGGPSPSLSGSHGRPDSRGPLSEDMMQQPHSLALRAASIGLLNGSHSAVGPRIRQLQQQLTLNSSTARLPALSLVSSSLTDPAFAPRGSLV